jgi:hypothetical protein
MATGYHPPYYWYTHAFHDVLPLVFAPKMERSGGEERRGDVTGSKVHTHGHANGTKVVKCILALEDFPPLNPCYDCTIFFFLR